MSITVTDTLTGRELDAREVRERARSQMNELRDQVAQLGHENAQLRKQLGGWTPEHNWRDINSVADLTERQHNAAMIEPTIKELRGDGPIAAQLVTGVDRKAGWPVWLDELHHAQRIEAERWAPLHAMLAESLARTGPVEQEWAEAPPPAAQLAPDVLDVDPAQQRPVFPAEHRKDRSDVERMKQRSNAQLRRRERDTSADMTLQDYLKAKDALDAHQAAKTRRPWWRRHADVIAGVAIGAGLFAALGVAYMTGVLT